MQSVKNSSVFQIYKLLTKKVSKYNELTLVKIGKRKLFVSQLPVQWQSQEVISLFRNDSVTTHC